MFDLYSSYIFVHRKQRHVSVVYRLIIFTSKIHKPSKKDGHLLLEFKVILVYKPLLHAVVFKLWYCFIELTQFHENLISNAKSLIDSI